MQYYFTVFIKFRKKSNPPEICTSEPMSYEECREQIELYVSAADFVESPFFVMRIFPVAQGNQRTVYQVSHDVKTDKEAV